VSENGCDYRQGGGSPLLDGESHPFSEIESFSESITTITLTQQAMLVIIQLVFDDQDCIYRRGQLWFYTRLARDVLTFPMLQDATLSLWISIQNAWICAKIRRADCRAGQVPSQSGGNPRPGRSARRRRCVMVTILGRRRDVWCHDITIPEQYGIDINVGDTRGPSGIFRALRTIPGHARYRP
jgi:hypothetical protein